MLMLEEQEPFLYTDGSIVKDFAEFSEKDVWIVSSNMINAKALIENEYYSIYNEQHTFFEKNKTYIYDILGAHWNLAGPILKIEKFIPGIMALIKQHPGKKFLEFGAGVGDICQTVYTLCNKEVTYLDIESYITEFARWRFKKYSLPITVKITPQNHLEIDGKYDIIYQDAVLSHLNPDQQLEYSKILASCLEKNGLMIIITDLGEENNSVPPKYIVDINKIHQTLTASGLQCLGGYGTFASVWKSEESNSEKTFTKFGIASIDYTDPETAKGFTYTTLQNEFPPTPILSPINPFNDEIIKAKNVLEIGCGVGRNLPYIMEKTNAHYWGIDPNREMLQYFWDISDIKYKNRVTLITDWSELPDNLKFDFVLSTFVFQHIAYMSPNNIMNVTDITKQAMKFTKPGTIWFVLEHEREQPGWQQRWMSECNITPEVYYRPGGNAFGGGTIPYPEFVSMVHRGNDNNIIIFKEKE